MRSDEIRAAFLDSFALQAHAVRVLAGMAVRAGRATRQPQATA